MHNDGFERHSGDDPSPYSVLRPRTKSTVLLICDHASNRVPAALADLGLSRSQLGQHIGWDIGAAMVTRHLSRHLNATAVLSGVSRLVIDCNRMLDDPTSIPSRSDGIVVPGNRQLAKRDKQQRASDWFHPYHDAVAAQLDRLEGVHRVAALISIHSFTPVMRGHHRPWSIGVLWDRDPKLASPVIHALKRQGHVVGDNEPYSGIGPGTVDTHAAQYGRPHVTFEIRQDLVAEIAGARAWARRLAKALLPLLGRSELRKHKIY